LIFAGRGSVDSPTRGGSQEFVFGIAELPAGRRLPLHAHRQAQLDYFLSGRARVRLGPRTVELGAGGCIYYPPEIPHALESLGRDPLRYAYTYASERVGKLVECAPASEEAAARAVVPWPTWMSWEETEDWLPIEPTKGLRVRYRRVMDREREVELIAGVAEIDPGIHYTLHYHDQPEIYYISAGRGVIYIEGGDVEVEAGSALYLPRRVVHGADSLGDAPLRIYYIYGCETAGHTINWTPVEEAYTEVRRH
jgi:mannose-6-phosphate isomerase-like protein (cupin superfamily)